MIIVLGCVAIAAYPFLSVLVAPGPWNKLTFPKQKVARSQVATIANELQIYLVDQGTSSLPASFSLNALAQGSNPYLKPSDLLDPWGRPFTLIVPGQNNAPFAVVSYGHDGVPGGDGYDADISSDSH